MSQPHHEEGPDANWGLVVAAAVGAAILIYGSALFPEFIAMPGFARDSIFTGNNTAPASRPISDLVRLMVAALVGLAVTTIHRKYHRDRPLPRSLLQAQVLLCIAGAVMMVIIGDSVARAFGVAGAAGIVRFKTPVEDPKDTTILFLLVALGMACGVGSLEIACLGATFLCLVLVGLDRFGEAKARTMLLQLVATSKEFPSDHVHDVLRASVENFEAREVIQGNEATVKYAVTMSQTTPIGWVSQQLMANGTAGVKSVSWSEPKTKG